MRPSLLPCATGRARCPLGRSAVQFSLFKKHLLSEANACLCTRSPVSAAHCISSVLPRQTVIFQPVRSDSSTRQSGTEHLGLYGQAAVPVSTLLSNLNPSSSPAFISHFSGGFFFAGVDVVQTVRRGKVRLLALIEEMMLASERSSMDLLGLLCCFVFHWVN